MTPFAFTERGTVMLAPCERFNEPIELPAAGFRNMGLMQLAEYKAVLDMEEVRSSFVLGEREGRLSVEANVGFAETATDSLVATSRKGQRQKSVAGKLLSAFGSMIAGK